MNEPSPSSLGTANLLNRLDGVIGLVEKFNDTPHPDPKGIEIRQQLQDLIAITTDLDDLATATRRNPSLSLTSLTETDLIHLRRIFSSISEITKECLVFLRPLKSTLEDILREKNTDFPILISREDPLERRPWYNETYQALQLRTEILHILLTAIHVLQHKNDTDDGGNLSTEARSLSTTLPYRIAVVDPKLHRVPAHTKLSVSENPILS